MIQSNPIARLALLLAGLGLLSHAIAAAADQPIWPTPVDLNPGETITATRAGATHTFRILNDSNGQPAITDDTMPFPTTSLDHRVNYAARVRLEVNGQEIELVARPFQYPIEAAGLRLYLDGTREWLATGLFPVNLPKRIRLRFTAAGESWGPASLRFPVGEYRWGATTYLNTWLGVVPQDVATTYYHKGEDFGAVPDLLPVLATEAGTVTTTQRAVQIRAPDGTVTRISHMNPPQVVVAEGQSLTTGQRLGLTGQFGNSDADPHLHYDFRRGEDRPGTYPFAVDAYLRDYPDAGVAIAGGYQFMLAGETLVLDGSRSVARPGREITGYRWILHDGTTVEGATARLTVATPGFYAQELRVFFDDGREERGFTPVRVFAPGRAGQEPVPGFVYQHPVRGITPGGTVTIRHHPFIVATEERSIDFGDGSPARAVSGSRPSVMHTYAGPGLYTVTVTTVGGLPQMLKTSVLVEPVSGASTTGKTAKLEYSPAPPDNPLKGFVPYPRERTSFPRSLEWDYVKLSDVMTGPTSFNWAPFDRKLEAAAARGCQFIARFYMEWPGRATGVPKFLLDDGVVLRTWTNTNTQPRPPAVDHTPDYEDPRLRAALTNFIHALGARYDGDPRLGFIGLGLLGTWGEWHNHPNTHWFASKIVQREVMDAYEAAFKQTKLVARYPAGPDHPRYADNSDRTFGYHDDSFAWATVHTGRRQDEWFFETLLRRAGALEKWRTQPIGGEVRPEVWDCLFEDPSCAPQGQEFERCLAVTHVSWLCNEGVFRPRLQGAARERALRAAQRLGYELQVQRAELAREPGGWSITLSVTNTGVAPFYYDWPVELGAVDAAGQLAATWTTDWKLTGILPGEPAQVWRHRVGTGELSPGPYRLLVRVPNPMLGGRILRFANREQDRDLDGWLTLGTVTP